MLTIEQETDGLILVVFGLLSGSLKFLKNFFYHCTHMQYLMYLALVELCGL